MNLQEHLNRQITSELVNKTDSVLKEALEKKGFDTKDHDFIKNNFQVIIKEDDPDFEHYYFHFGEPDEIRILSIQRIPTISFSDCYEDGMIKVHADQKYY